MATSNSGPESVDREGDENDQEDVSANEINYDEEPICGCIPHLWKGSVGIVDYHVCPSPVYELTQTEGEYDAFCVEIHF